MAALTKDIYREEGADREAAPAKKEDKPKGLSDTEILSLLSAEKSASIGFENGTELERKRTQALEYSKGVMTDVPSLPNRSRAVSTDIAEAVETILPDLMDIFTGGEDVAAFAPVSQDDEERAQQETDWVNHVAFQKLPGFLLLYTAIKDALQVDTGILMTWWQDNESAEEEEVEGKSAVELKMAVDGGAELVGQPVPAGMTADGVELFNAKLTRSYDKGCIKSAAIDPSNFTVAQDATLDWNENVYCAVRSFPRAQALLDQGFPKDKVAQLPAYSQRTGNGNEQTEQARDVAGENASLVQQTEGSGPEGADGKSLMRTVEVHKHFVKADLDKSGKSQLWCVQTDADCKVILHKKKINRRGLSAGTPFINAHRFYGMSIAEKLVEVQKIKTALLRLMLDSGYFAMNQRVEVAMDQATGDTINDLMDNRPLVPVRTKNGNGIKPLQAGALGFDVGMALEYASAMGELRTGVVRNAQGLNPDSLHETAKGAMALMTMAQKRVRMIARVLAETLIKGWFLDIHALSRQHATRAEKVRLRGTWVDVDPSSFGDRSDMVIEVGVGSGGKELELAAIDKILQFQEKAMLAAGGEAPVVAWQNVHNALKRFCERAGFKAPELFFTNPEAEKRKKDEENAARAERGEPPIEEPPPPPSPEEIKAKGELELQAKKHQDTMALEGQKAQAKQASDQQATAMKAQQDAAQADRDFQLKQMQIAADERAKAAQADRDMALKREEMDRTFALKEKQMLGELELKRGQLNAELQMNMQIERMKIDAGVYTKANGSGTSEVHMGGEAGA